MRRERRRSRRRRSGRREGGREGGEGAAGMVEVVLVMVGGEGRERRGE